MAVHHRFARSDGSGSGSLTCKGGPRYGIDLKGGALVYVKFAIDLRLEQLRSALEPSCGGMPEMQEVTGTNEVIIGTEQRDENEQERSRAAIVETLAATYGSAAVGQAGSQQRRRSRRWLTGSADRLPQRALRFPSSSCRISRPTSVSSVTLPPRSGVLRSFDDLQGVPGVTSQVIQVLKQETFTAPYSIRNIEIVGPKMGQELRKQAIYVVLLRLAGMLIYIGFRFEWIYGVAAVLAVFHDTIITIGLFSILNKEISLTVIAALLTLVGYSMNDTIVVFDRIRENLKLNKRGRSSELVNASINQTLSRTIADLGLDVSYGDCRCGSSAVRC